MGVRSGFFNSSNSDRVYTAYDFGSIFDGLITDGVFEKVGDCFLVIPGAGMQIIVKTGRAWFDHTWTVNDTLLPLSMELGDVTQPRYDAVVIEVNQSDGVRKNDIKIVNGTPSPNPVWPSLYRSDEINQYPVAYIRVGANADHVSSTDIDQRTGKADCPYVRVPPQANDITDLFQKWGGEFGEWFTQLKTDMNDQVVADFLAQIEALRHLDYDVPATVLTNKWLLDATTLLDTTLAGIFETVFNPKLKTKTEIITSSTTWNKPVNAQDITVRLFGGGAGGYTDSGGGGGHMFYGKLDIPSTVTSIPITIGKGGEPGSAGGTTSFGTYASAAGGSGANGGTGGGGSCAQNISVTTSISTMPGSKTKKINTTIVESSAIKNGGNASYGGSGGNCGLTPGRDTSKRPINAGSIPGKYGGGGGLSGRVQYSEVGYIIPESSEYGGSGGHGGENGYYNIVWNNITNENITFSKDSHLRYCNDRFMILCDSTGGVYSYDGLIWEEFTLPFAASWHDVAYGDGLYIAVQDGYDNRIAVSYNGIKWYEKNIGDNAIYRRAIIYKSGKFVTVRGHLSDKAAYSSDGLTWTQTTLPFSALWTDILYINGLFILPNESGKRKIIYSDDGISWSEADIPLDKISTIYNEIMLVAYGNGVYLICNGYRLLRGPSLTDFDAWEIIELPLIHNDGRIYSLTYMDGLFVAIGDYYSYVSEDGIAWKSSPLGHMTNNPSAVLYKNDAFITFLNNDGVVAYGNKIRTNGTSGSYGKNGINTLSLLNAEFKGDGSGSSGGNGGFPVDTGPEQVDDSGYTLTSIGYQAAGGSGGGGGGYGGKGGAGGSIDGVAAVSGGGGGGGGYGGNGGNGGAPGNISVDENGFSVRNENTMAMCNTAGGGGGGGGYGGNGGNGGSPYKSSDVMAIYRFGGGGGGGGYGIDGIGGNGASVYGQNAGNGGRAAGGGGHSSLSRCGKGGDGICIITYSYYE